MESVTQQPFELKPDDVPGMFRELGIRPRRRAFLSILDDGRLCGCVAGVLIAKHIGVKEAMTPSVGYVEKLKRATGIESVWSLASGWDDNGGHFLAQGEPDHEKYRDLGRAAWQACVEAGLCSE